MLRKLCHVMHKEPQVVAEAAGLLWSLLLSHPMKSYSNYKGYLLPGVFVDQLRGGSR